MFKVDLSNKVVAIGISQRTKPEAIERISREIFFSDIKSDIEVVLAFDIPKCRAFMHLDTVFTQIDYYKFKYHPGIMENLQVFGALERLLRGFFVG